MDGATEKFAPGNIVKGKVARMTDFGAFIELAPGVDALLHVSQISKDHVEKPSDVLKIGQEVEAKVVEFNVCLIRISPVFFRKSINTPAHLLFFIIIEIYLCQPVHFLFKPFIMIKHHNPPIGATRYK